jgi:peptide chain release factor subunit 1
LKEIATYFHACNLATSNSVKQHKLRKQIAWLASKEGSGKEFISLFIPKGTPIDQIIAKLKAEQNSEVKPQVNKIRLQDTIHSVIQHLKQKNIIPDTGIALFAGFSKDNDSENEHLTIEEILPPEPIANYHYSVDNHFDLQPLREMFRDQKIVGAIVLDAKAASFGLLNGEHLEFLESISSGIPGKSGKGGQSQRRYERERVMELSYFFHRIGEHANKAFMANKVNVLVVGGPGQTKNDFLKCDFLHYELMNALVNIVDTQTVDKEGLRDALGRSTEQIRNMCGPVEKRFMQRFMVALSKDGLVTYGLVPVLQSLRLGEVEVALVTDDSGLVEVVLSCKKCGLLRSKIVLDTVQTLKDMLSLPCEKCGSIEYEVMKKDIVDVLEDLAVQTNASVEVISTTSTEKNELAALGGVAALLRYKPEYITRV